MIALSINTANVFGGNGDIHLSQTILNFTSDYVRTIYRKIFEIIPCLEEHPEWYFDTCWNEAEQRNIVDDEENGVINDEEISNSDYHSDVNYIYYKGKGVNINIYHKATEIQKEKLSFDPYRDYDFLRIEVQVKKSKLNSLVTKHKLNKGELRGRELEYLISPEVEQEILTYYVNGLTGTGLYVTYNRAMKIIDESKYGNT